MVFLASLLAAFIGSVTAVDLSNLPHLLQSLSNARFPELQDIAVEIYHNPELGRDEHDAHDLIVNYFSGLGQWQVTPHAYGVETALEVVFENRPLGFSGKLPTIGFLAEYDALEGVGHACGHNHIALHGMAAAIFAAEALVEYEIPGEVRLVGCPDEENAAGKFTLNQKRAFESSDIWMMAHPTATSAVQPMNARLNLFPTFVGPTHEDAVKRAYQAMLSVADIPGGFPGVNSSAATILNVGMYAVNVVQTQISLGVVGPTANQVEDVLGSILDDTFPEVTFAVARDDGTGGVAMNMTGPGGHASEGTKGALRLAIETFRHLSQDSSFSFYLPGNTTLNELGVTVDLRSRYTSDLPALADFVSARIDQLAASITSDVKYPSLELVPYFPETFLNLIKTAPYGMTDWVLSDFAPASTDASWIENAEVDPITREVMSVAKAVFHANYGICELSGSVPCAFNHEPAFRTVAGTEFSYRQTEIVARAEAQMAVELLADPEQMRQATAIVRR